MYQRLHTHANKCIQIFSRIGVYQNIKVCWCAGCVLSHSGSHMRHSFWSTFWNSDVRQTKEIAVHSYNVVSKDFQVYMSNSVFIFCMLDYTSLPIHMHCCILNDFIFCTLTSLTLESSGWDFYWTLNYLRGYGPCSSFLDRWSPNWWTQSPYARELSFRNQTSMWSSRHLDVKRWHSPEISKRPSC